MTPLSAHVHPPRRAARAVQATISFLLSASMSSVYVLGAFTLPVEHVTSPHLHGLWPASIALSLLLYSPVMVLSGLLLSHAPTHARTTTARLLSLFASTCTSLLALAALGVAAQAAVAVRVGVSLQGVSIGVYTLLSLELFLAWLPSAPGLAVALSSLSFNAGCAFWAWFFAALTRTLPPVWAISVAAASLSGLMGICTMFVRFPEYGEIDDEDLCVLGMEDGVEELPLLDAHLSDRIDIWNALQSLTMWLYVLCALTVGAAFALVPYFYRLGAVLDAPAENVTRAFQIGSFAGVPFCIVLSLSIGRFRTRIGRFSCAARNVMFSTLILQAVLCILLSRLSGSGDRPFEQFALLVTAVRALYMVHNCTVALLAREMFGSKNVAFVYGVGGGMALGSGEAVSVAVMAWIDGKQGGITRIQDCRPYFQIVACWSVATAVGMLFMRKLRTCN